MSPSQVDGAPTRVALLAAFAALYLIWGSTYLAIRFAIETLPPLLMAGFRFLVAGTLLMAWVRLRGGPRPERVHWRNAWITGGLLLLGGNGAVVWAQQWIPSGLAALLVSTVPLWMVLVDWLWGKGSAPTLGLMVGLLWGMLGVAILVGSAAGDAAAGGASPLAPVAAVVVLGGAFSWAVGSVFARYAGSPPSPGLGTAMQMLAGGTLLTGAGLLAGEAAGVDPASFSLRSLLALGYLVVFGSLVGFSAYIWLLKVSTPARVSTYAYVNPAVALLLGWALAGEPLTRGIVLGSGVVLSAVMFIATRKGPGRPPGSGAPGPREEAAGDGQELGEGEGTPVGDPHPGGLPAVHPRV